MKKILLSLTAILSSAVMTAQDVSQFKQLDDSLFASTPAYQNGNRYQRDAMLFVDMLADTHPYYIKKERRDILFARQDDLLKACAACGSDTAFVSLLRNTLGDLRDKHTDIIDMQQLKADRQAAAEKAEAQADTLSDALMAYKGDLFHYVIVPEAKVCYLQFNRCMDARTMRDTSLPRWDTLLDEIVRIKAACGWKLLKVIIECCLLTEAEKIRLCGIVGASGADFIKTSTGFSKGGATREDVELLRRYSPEHVKVKAAGGIASLADAEDFIALGAERLGTSRIVKLAMQLESESGAPDESY